MTTHEENPTQTKLLSANAALLAHRLVHTHGVDPDFVEHVARDHAGEVPYKQNGELHEEGLATLAARVATAVPNKFRTARALSGDPTAYDAVAAGRQMAAEQKRVIDLTSGGLR